MRRLLLGLLIGATGCGYQLAARPPLPGGASAVSVPLLQNDTSEPELGRILADALARRAEADDRLGTGPGHLRLTGRVEQVRALGAAYVSGVAGPSTWQVELRVRLRLEPAGGGPAVREFTVQGAEPYLAGVGPEQTEANRRRAVSRLAERLAEAAWEKLLAGSD